MIWDIVISASLVIGGVFALVGSYGLLKLDNPMSRLHAPTKASTLGVGSLLLASMLAAFHGGTGSMHELLIMAFLFATAPITAHFLAKVHIHKSERRGDLPPPSEDTLWATQNGDAAKAVAKKKDQSA